MPPPDPSLSELRRELEGLLERYWLGGPEDRLADADNVLAQHLPTLLAALEERDSRIDAAESLLASATDLANTYAREVGVQEADRAEEIRGVIERIAWKANRSKSEREWAVACIKSLLIRFQGMCQFVNANDRPTTGDTRDLYRMAVGGCDEIDAYLKRRSQ